MKCRRAGSLEATPRLGTQHFRTDNDHDVAAFRDGCFLGMHSARLAASRRPGVDTERTGAEQLKRTDLLRRVANDGIDVALRTVLLGLDDLDVMKVHWLAAAR